MLFERIVMAGGGNAVADPDARRRLHAVGREVEIVRAAEPGQAGIDQQRSDVIRRRLRVACMRRDFIQHLAQSAASDLAVQRREIIVVERTPGDIRTAVRILHRLGRCRSRAGRPLPPGVERDAGLHQAPVAGQALEQCGLACIEQFAERQCIGPDTVQHTHTFGHLDHVVHTQAMRSAAAASWRRRRCFSAISRRMLCIEASTR